MVYGISDFGLSNNLGISRKGAKAYIDTYFERFPGIKNYMDEVVRGRRVIRAMWRPSSSVVVSCQISILATSIFVVLQSERPSNSPIQGSAADILKIAMIPAG